MSVKDSGTAIHNNYHQKTHPKPKPKEYTSKKLKLIGLGAGTSILF